MFLAGLWTGSRNENENRKQLDAIYKLHIFLAIDTIYTKCK